MRSIDPIPVRDVVLTQKRDLAGQVLAEEKNEDGADRVPSCAGIHVFLICNCSRLHAGAVDGPIKNLSANARSGRPQHDETIRQRAGRKHHFVNVEVFRPGVGMLVVRLEPESLDLVADRRVSQQGVEFVA